MVPLCFLAVLGMNCLMDLWIQLKTRSESICGYLLLLMSQHCYHFFVNVFVLLVDYFRGRGCSDLTLFPICFVRVLE